MTMQSRVVGALALIVLFSLAATGTVDGGVPTAADHAACNAQAPDAIKTGGASPTTRDRARAATARDGARTERSTEVTGNGNVVESSDPQIHGMEGEGAKDAAFQAAYRSCMRRKGF